MCLTCLLSRFTKLSYAVSESHASEPLDLIHIDTWGPYKVNSKGKYGYFLTMVDDHTIVTWIHLLERKK